MIVEADYESLELRVLALMSRNELAADELVMLPRRMPRREVITGRVIGRLSFPQEPTMSTRDIILARITDVFERAGIVERMPLPRILDKVFPPADAAIWADVAKMLDVDQEIVNLFEKREPRKPPLSGTAGFIDAIKLYRELTGAGLADSKRVVEKLVKDYKICTCSVDAYGGAIHRGNCGEHESQMHFYDANRALIQETLSPSVESLTPYCRNLDPKSLIPMHKLFITRDPFESYECISTDPEDHYQGEHWGLHRCRACGEEIDFQ